MAAVALLAAGVMGAGVTAVLAAPAAVRQPAPHVIAKPIAVSKPLVVKPLAPSAARVAPTVSNIKATFVSANTDSVTVEGMGTISGTPDVLLVSLQANHEAATAREALDGANGIVQRLLATLRSHGVKPADMQSTGLSLNPTYDYDNGKSTKTGYASGQSLAVKLRSAEQRGETISAAAAVSEDVTINGLSFDLENNAGLLARAQNAAFAMAKDEAARYAGLAGRSLGRVMAINQMTNSTSPSPMGLGAGGLAAGAPASSVPLAEGSQPVSVSVVVTWSLR